MTDQRSAPATVGTGSGLLILAILVLLAIRSPAVWLVNLRRWLWCVLNLPPAHVVACSVVALAVLVAVAVSGVAWLRMLWTRRTLASRVSYYCCRLLLPADDFDPSEVAVLRAAGQLSRVRGVVLGWLDTRASAVRLRMDSGPEGRVLYRV